MKVLTQCQMCVILFMLLESTECLLAWARGNTNGHNSLKLCRVPQPASSTHVIAFVLRWPSSRFDPVRSPDCVRKWMWRWSLVGSDAETCLILLHSNCWTNEKADPVIAEPQYPNQMIRQSSMRHLCWGDVYQPTAVHSFKERPLIHFRP